MSKADAGQYSFHPRLLILLVMGAFGVMGGGLLAPGLPALMEPFGVGGDRVGFVLSIYTLSAALTLPCTGLLVDLLGRRLVGIACLLIDGVFGLLCILAPSFTVLLALRFIQGIGIAGLIPVAMTVLSDLHTGRARVRLIGFLSGTISLSAVIIPLLGGVLASIDWRLPFTVYGLSILLAVFYALFIAESREAPPGRKDTLQRIRMYSTSLRKALALEAVREVFLHSLVLFFLLYTMVTFVPLYLVVTFGAREFVAGLALSIQGFVAALVASKSDRVHELLAWRTRLMVGFGLILVALISLPLWGRGLGPAVSLFCFGLGMGLVQPAIYNRATTVGPPALTGSVVALFNTMKYTGMTLAPLLLRHVQIRLGLGRVFIAAALLVVGWMVLFWSSPRFGKR